MKNSTAMEEVSRVVPDEAVSTAEDDKARRLATVNKAIAALQDIHYKLGLIEAALGKDLPECLREQPMGDAIDMISDLSIAMKDIGGDGGSLSKAKKRVDFAKEVTMPERMDAEKVTTFNTDRYRVTRLSKVFASIVGGQSGQPAAFEWLRNNDLGELVKETVNASSLSAVAKQMIEDGKELPEDIFQTAYKNSLSVTRKKPS